MTVYFTNRGVIDMLAVTTLGVSVKTADSPIGYFGTGFKFAVATLLRTGHHVTVHAGGVAHEFTTSRETIRGESFDLVRMGDQRLSFTTQLGRDWEVWQAYRELACNAMDEPDGAVETTFLEVALEDPDRTTVAVRGPTIDAVHAARDQVFCDGAPVLTRSVPGEVRAGSSVHLFYRGVRALSCPRPALQTYNILRPMDLTEDRTLRSPWSALQAIAAIVARSTSEDVVRRVIGAPQAFLESLLDFDTFSAEPSEVFLRVVAEQSHDVRISESARRLWLRHRPEPEEATVVLSEIERQTLERARVLVLAINPDYVESPPIRIVRTLGPDVHGVARGVQVSIAREVLQRGAEWTAATLYEEYLHAHCGYLDMTRSLQDHLFQRLVTMAAERLALPA